MTNNLDFFKNLSEALAFSAVYVAKQEWLPTADAVCVGKGSIWDTALLTHVFQNTACAGLGDASGLQPSAAAGNLYVSLHTADPGFGQQNTNEAVYTGYARAAVPRSTTGWAVAGAYCSNGTSVTFATCTGGAATVGYFGVGTSLSGTGTLLWSGSLTASLAISNGIQPQFAVNALNISES